MNAKLTLRAFGVAAALAIAAPLATVASHAAMTVMVGGAPMYPSKNIVENAVHSKDHTTLVAAVKAAGLVDTLAAPDRSPCSRRPMKPSPCCRKAQSLRC